MKPKTMKPKIYRGRREDGELTVTVQTFYPDTRKSPTVKPLVHISHHSPDGFEWGYLGSGPADLSLAILADHFEEDAELVQGHLRSMWAPRSKAVALHQDFKDAWVAFFPKSAWVVTAGKIASWLNENPHLQERLDRLAEEDQRNAEIRDLTEREAQA